MEKISDNKLEDSFVKAWKPLLLLQTAIGSARANLVDNNVTPRVWYQKVYSCVNVVLCCLSLVYLTHRSALQEIDPQWDIQAILSYSQVAITLGLNSCPIIVNNFFHIEENYNLFISLQNIDRALKITTNENHYKIIHRINTGYITFLLLIHVVFDSFVVMQNIGYHDLYLAIPAIFTLLAQDLEVAFFTGTIIYLILRVKYINSLLKRIVDVKWKSLKHLESQAVIGNILAAYRHVLKVYVLIQKTSNLFIFFLCLHMFSNELLALEGFISQRKPMNSLSLFQSAMLVVKVYNRVLFIGTWVTRLEHHILSTRLVCLRVINETNYKGFRRQVKNLLRLVTPVRPMTVFGMCTVGSLPVRLAALTTTYAVVLLQINLQGHTPGILNLETTTASVI